MGHDPFSPVAPALINILCVPADRLSPQSFNDYVRWLQHNCSDLGKGGADTQSNSHDSAALLNFASQPDSKWLQRSTFFEPNRHPQIVLGLIDGRTLTIGDDGSMVQHANARLREFTSRTSQFELPSILVVFDAPDGFQSDDVITVQTDAPSLEKDRLHLWLLESTTSSCTRAIETLRSQEAELPQSTQTRYLDAKQNESLGSKTSEDIAEDDAYAATSGKIVAEALLRLQMGSWTEALDRLADGARAARDANSPAWHAKALEGILVCLLLHAWAGKDFQIPQNCYPTNRGFSSSSAVHSIADANRAVSEKFAGTTASRLQALTAMLPGLLATIMNLYDRASMGFGNSLPQTLVCEARVRLATLLVVVRKHGCLLNAAALDELIGSRKDMNLSPPLDPPTSSMTLRSTAIASLLIESINEAQVQLPIQAASVIYLAVCQRLSNLQLERKQGFHLKDILQRLPPLLVEARMLGAAEAAVNPSMTGLTAFSAADKTHGRVAAGVRALLQLAVRNYGLPDPSVKYDSTDVEATAKSRLTSWLSVFVSGDIATKLEFLRLCVRVSDALPDLVGSVQFMSFLLFICRQSIIVRPGPNNAVPLIAAEEQNRLANGINNAVSAAQRTGSSQTLAEYWDDFLVQGVELYESPTAGKLMPHSSQDLSLTTTTGTSKKDPFIYNPFSGGRKASGPAILVKDEITHFDVTLQNPLEIDIEIESISLTVEGCDFEPLLHNVIIGPLMSQVFPLKGTPRSTGDLKITGCKAKVKNCHEKSFAIFSGVFGPPQIIKRKQLYDLAVDLPETKILDLKVVEPLPTLHLDNTSLTQRSLMLLDGEKAHLTMTLDNPGSLPADLVLFSFQDSVSRQLQDALSTKDMQPADTYELQWQLTHRPAVRRVLANGEKAKSIASVGPKSSATFEFEVLGKPGLTEVEILIDYAYIGKPRSEVEGTFYTRQIRVPISVTVMASVDMVRCGVLSIPENSAESMGHQAQANGKTPASATKEQEDAHDIHSQCLLQLDLRSIWQHPLTVTIETLLPSSCHETPQYTPATTTTLHPTHPTRTLILLPRLFIADPHAPIPSLAINTRQFVVSASKLSLETELAAREAFWYREEACKRLRIRWREERVDGGKAREGEIDVRKGIRLGQRMIDCLRVEHVQVEFKLVPALDGNGGRGIVSKAHGAFEVRRNMPLRLVTVIKNLTSHNLPLLLRLQPSLSDQPHNNAMDLSKKLVWSGVLQKVMPGGVPPGGSARSELGIVCLAAGEYEINASVEEVRGRRREIEGVVGVDGERRIWHARRPCLIKVVDE